MMICKPGNLPAAGTGKVLWRAKYGSRSRVIGRTIVAGAYMPVQTSYSVSCDLLTGFFFCAFFDNIPIGYLLGGMSKKKEG